MVQPQVSSHPKSSKLWSPPVIHSRILSAQWALMVLSGQEAEIGAAVAVLFGSEGEFG